MGGCLSSFYFPGYTRRDRWWNLFGDLMARLDRNLVYIGVEVLDKILSPIHPRRKHPRRQDEDRTKY
jgi:hypothetical protein